MFNIIDIHNYYNNNFFPEKNPKLQPRKNFIKEKKSKEIN